MVYIEEAHPTDGWAFENTNISISSHRKLADRIEAARYLEKDSAGKINVVVDNMKDESNKAYGGLYERLYIIQNGVIEYQGGKGPAGFKVNEVEDWLVNYKKISTVETVTTCTDSSDTNNAECLEESSK